MFIFVGELYESVVRWRIEGLERTVEVYDRNVRFLVLVNAFVMKTAKRELGV